MTDLIERLEAGTEGSRELDLRIWCQVEGYDCGNIIDTMLFYSKDGVNYIMDAPTDKVVPFYTTSIDAALTLVPEDWRLECLREMLSSDVFECELHRRSYNQAILVVSDAAPLAICIASLKAIKQGEG